MTVTASWTSPAAAGTLDLAAGATLTEAVWDAMVSNFLYLGGTGGVVTYNDGVGNTFTQSTTSSSFVAITGVVTGTLTLTGSTQFIFISGNFANTTLGVINAIGYSVDGGAYIAIARWTQPVANHLVQISGFAVAAIGSGSHTIQMGWLTSGGTLSTDVNLTLRLHAIEPRR